MATDLDRILKDLEGHTPDPDQAYVSRVINVNGVLKTVQIPVPKSSAASIAGATRATPSIPVAPVRPNTTIPVANVRPSVQAVPRITPVPTTASTTPHNPAVLQLSNGMTITLPQGLQQQNQIAGMQKVVVQPQQNPSGGLNAFNLLPQAGGGFTLVPNTSVAQNRSTSTLQLQSTPQGTFQLVQAPATRTLQGNVSAGLPQANGPSQNVQYPRLVLVPQGASTAGATPGNTTNIVFNMNSPQPSPVAPAQQFVVNTGQANQQPGLVMINPQNQQTTVVQSNMLVLQQGGKTTAAQATSTSSSLVTSTASISATTNVSTTTSISTPRRANNTTIQSPVDLTQENVGISTLLKSSTAKGTFTSSKLPGVRSSDGVTKPSSGVSSLQITSVQSLANNTSTPDTGSVTAVIGGVTAKSSAPIIPITEYLSGPNRSSGKDVPAKASTADPWLDSFVQFAQITAPIPHEKPAQTDLQSSVAPNKPVPALPKQITTIGKLPSSVKLKNKSILPKLLSNKFRNSSLGKEQRRPGKSSGIIRDFGEIQPDNGHPEKQAKRHRKRRRNVISSDDSDADFEISSLDKERLSNKNINVELRHKKVNYCIHSDSDDDIPIQWKGGKRRKMDYAARFKSKPLKEGPPEVLKKLIKQPVFVVLPETKKLHNLKDCNVVLDYFDMKGRLSATRIFVKRTINAHAKAKRPRSKRIIKDDEDSQISTTSVVSSRGEKPFTLSFGLAPFLPPQLRVSGGQDGPLTVDSVSSPYSEQNRAEYEEDTDVEEEPVTISVLKDNPNTTDSTETTELTERLEGQDSAKTATALVPETAEAISDAAPAVEQPSSVEEPPETTSVSQASGDVNDKSVESANTDSMQPISRPNGDHDDQPPPTDAVTVPSEQEPSQTDLKTVEKTAVIKPLSSVSDVQVEDQADERIDRLGEVDTGQGQCLNEAGTESRPQQHVEQVQDKLPTVIEPVDLPVISQTDAVHCKTAVISPMSKDTVDKDKT